ncbi:unnamed protein product [Closterium sp. NIES-64]|nr:unnamed protein product [Closterium sp. NIES-64]
MLSRDPTMARVTKCMQAAYWCAWNDAPIVLYPMLVRFMAEQGCPDMVDITEVKNHVDKVKTKLAQRYVEPGASFGQNDSRLAKFIDERGSQEKRTIEIKGVDDSGKQATTKVTLHEEKIGEGAGSDMESCKDLTRRFAQNLVKALGNRMADLRHYDGVQFFQPDQYPTNVCDQEPWLKTHLAELLDLFKNQLPGNIVEFERGFSRQNIIKAWDRTALTDVKLGELMTVKMLDYPVDWAEAYAVFEAKGRRPAT